MPLYPFVCEACGPFEEWRPLSEAGNLAWCPSCRHKGRRVYTAPGVVRTPPAIRAARGLEEKSTHEPEIVRGPASELPGRRFRRRGRPHPSWVLGH
jgi:putative FmdB family regulatory protein